MLTQWTQNVHQIQWLIGVRMLKYYVSSWCTYCLLCPLCFCPPVSFFLSALQYKLESVGYRHSILGTRLTLHTNAWFYTWQITFQLRAMHAFKHILDVYAFSGVIWCMRMQCQPLYTVTEIFAHLIFVHYRAYEKFLTTKISRITVLL